MSALAHYVGDVSVFSIGGTDLLAVFEDVTLAFLEDTVDGSAVTRLGKRAEGQKLSATLTTKVMSTLGSGDRVGHLNLSAATIDGTDELGLLRSLKFNGSFEHRERAGVGSLWKRPQVTAKDYDADFECDHDADTAYALVVDMLSATPANRDMILSATINSIATTLPMRLTSLELGAARDELQTLKGKLMGKDPGGATAYPTASTGTTTVLEKALNAPKTALTCVFTSNATDGVSFTGSYVFDSFSFEVQDSQLVYNSFSLKSYGAITPSQT